MKKNHIFLTCLVLCVSSCFAREMHLSEDSPFGKAQTGLEIQYTNTSPEEWTPRQQHFKQVLSRYIGIQTKPLKKNEKAAQPWVLQLQLDKNESLLKTPFIMGQSENKTTRLRLEIKAKGILNRPSGHKVKQFEWVERGDTPLQSRKLLEAQLMDRLSAQVYRSLSPHYVYR